MAQHIDTNARGISVVTPAQLFGPPPEPAPTYEEVLAMGYPRNWEYMQGIKPIDWERSQELPR